MYLSSKGILTFFPFPIALLRNWLGSTYSYLNNIAKKPLLFRYYSFSLYFDPTITGILISIRSTNSYELISTLPERLSTT